MANLTVATIFIVMLNVMMWFSGLAMTDMNPDGTMCYNIEGSVIDNAITQQGDGTALDNDIANDLPDPQGAVAGETTNVFTDIFNSVLGWFKSAPGLRYVYGVVAAPYNILKCMNLPSEFVIGIGTIWYLVSLLVLVAFLWGR